MTTWCVSRHPGAAEWARRHGGLPDDARIVQELDPRSIAAGDCVIGNLPAHLAAIVCERGARYEHIKLDLSLEQRGTELTADELERSGAMLSPYHVEALAPSRDSGRKNLHVLVVSGEALPNFLPLKLAGLKPDRVVLLASSAMRNAASRLKTALQQDLSITPDIRFDFPDRDVADIAARARSLAAELAKTSPQHRLLLNLTGGNKLMALGLQQGMRSQFEIYYCDTAHDRIEWLNPPGRSPQVLPPDLLDIRRYLLAQGLTTGGSVGAGIPYAPSAEEGAAAHTLAGNATCLGVDFFRMLNNAAGARDTSRRQGDAKPQPFMHLGQLNDDQFAAVEMLAGKGFGTLYDDRFEVGSQQRQWSFLAGGWLEVYCGVVAKSLEGHGLGRQRWAVNLKVNPIEVNNSRFPMQELDAVIVHRNRMLIIECKTGIQMINDDNKDQQVLNKLEVIGDQIAGLLATRWLLTTVPANRLLDSTRRRAERYRIRLFDIDQLKNLESAIREWMQAPA